MYINYARSHLKNLKIFSIKKLNNKFIMGIISKTIIIIIPISSITIYSLHSLGHHMPYLCRKTGNYLGLFYHLFRTTLQKV